MAVIDSKNQPQPYVFREYPKWVTPPGGPPVLVADPAAERAALGPAPEPEPPAPEA